MPETQNHTVHAEFLDAILEGAIDCIIIINGSGEVVRFNRAAVQLFGFQPEEIIGHNISKLMPEPHRSEHNRYIDKYAKTRVPAIIGVGREVEAVKKDGTKIPVRLAVSEVKVNGSTYFTGVLHDLSDLKEQQRQVEELTRELEKKVRERTDELQVAINKLLKTNKKLEHEIQERRAAETALRKSQIDLKESLEKEKELSELKSRFVSTASHEFRTPLSTILSSASLLGRYTEADQQPKREKHIDRVKNSVRTLTTILDDFLSLSKLEHGEVVLKMEEIDVGAFVREVVDEIEGILKPGQFVTMDDRTDKMRMSTDVTVLRNILYNLLSNAIKYSDEGEIKCIARKEDHMLVVDIVDHGIGIPSSDQKHLFDGFFGHTMRLIFRNWTRFVYCRKLSETTEREYQFRQ